jgi:hypothetical protein
MFTFKQLTTRAPEQSSGGVINPYLIYLSTSKYARTLQQDTLFLFMVQVASTTVCTKMVLRVSASTITSGLYFAYLIFVQPAATSISHRLTKRT